MGRERADALGVGGRFSAVKGDLNEPLPFENGFFDAVMSLDVVLHLRDRLQLFREVARVLSPCGRFLLTDAGVITGSVTNEELRRRSILGYAQFVPPAWNETLLESAGFRMIETENRTRSVSKNAGGRLAAMEAHRAELERVPEGVELLAQKDYLEAAFELARRHALSRMMYLAEVSTSGARA